MKKRIIVHDYAGHPFQVQLSRALAKKGHYVLHLYAGYNQTPRGDLQKKNNDPATFLVEGVYIKENLQKYNYYKRWRQEIEYGNLIKKRIDNFGPDLIISANSPLDSQKIIIDECKKNNIQFVFWLQDILGLGAKRLLSKKYSFIGSIIGDYYVTLEKRLLLQSEKIISITADFLPLLRKWKVSEERVITIPNWAPIDNISVHNKKNPWSIEHKIDDKFVVLYSGTLGLKHNPSLITNLANNVKNLNDIQLVVVSEGPGANYIKKAIENQNISNITLLPYQPFEILPQVLASADILLTILEPEAGIFSVPSKVLTNMCAQRAQLLSCPSDNLASKIIEQNEAGIVVKPGSVNDLVDAVIYLYQNPKTNSKMGINGRKYAELNFQIDQISEKLLKFLNI